MSSQRELQDIRAQLQSELGYDASSFPDDVLLAVLADLTIDTSGRAAPAPIASESARAERPRRYEFESVVEGEEHEPSLAPRARGQAQREHTYVDEHSYEAVVHKSAAPAATQRPSTAGRRAPSGAAVRVPLVDSPPQRPSTAPRPQLARAEARSPRAPQSDSKLQTSRSRLGFGSASGVAGFGSASGVGYIVTSSAAGARVKSDPVAMRQAREKQWGSNAFLKSMQSPRHRHEPVASTRPGTASLDSYRVRHDRVPAQQHKSRASTAQLPTQKRRDNVVWETRQRLVRDHIPHQTKFTSAPRVRNAYVPPTSQRRDELRWQVRSELAVVY